MWPKTLFLTPNGAVKFTLRIPDEEVLQLCGFKALHTAKLGSNYEELIGNLSARSIDIQSRQVICQNIKQVILCAPHPDQQFASTSFYELRSVAFVSQLGFHYIPPECLTKDISVYALFDNIFHEALHQHLINELYDSDEDEEIENYNYRIQGDSIFVEWRQAEWASEHAFQAAYVYRNLWFFRALNLDRRLGQFNREEIVEVSRDCALYLVRQLLIRRTSMPKHCYNWLTESYEDLQHEPRDYRLLSDRIQEPYLPIH